MTAGHTKKKRSLRSAGRIASLFACGLLTLLVGCGEEKKQDKYADLIERKVILEPGLIKPREDVSGGKMAAVLVSDDPLRFHSIVPGADAPIAPPTMTTGADGVPADDKPDPRNDDSDYIAKADVYWKLNWLRKQIANGTLPSDFSEALDKTRTQLKTTRTDANYRLAEEAIEHITKGLTHYENEKTLAAAQVNALLIPWNGGREVLQRFIDQGGLGFAGKDTIHRRNLSRDRDDDATPLYQRIRSAGNKSLPATQQKALEIVLDYAGRYGNSPEQMKRQEWALAVEKINKLRDELGLMNRKENADSFDIKKPALSSGAEGMNGIVPVPESPTGGGHGETGTKNRPPF